MRYLAASETLIEGGRRVEQALPVPPIATFPNTGGSRPRPTGEPFGAESDFVTGVQILELLQKQAADGRAVLVVTHNREISRVADRVVELSSGRIVSDGPPAGGKASLADLHW